MTLTVANRFRSYSLASTVALLTLILIIVVLDVSSFYLHLLGEFLVFALLAMSVGLLVGYLGLFSFGHAAFFGIGAYVAALLSIAGHRNLPLNLLLAGLAAGVLGCAFGALALRAIGPYFLILTISLAQIPWGIAMRWRSVTGGDDGLPGVPRASRGVPWDAASSEGYVVTIIVVFLLVLVALRYVVDSPFGTGLVAIKDSETRMQALGYNTWLYKYIAFVLSAVFSGIAGALFAYHNLFVNTVELSLVRSADAVVMVVLGGSGTLVGPVVGAGLIVGARTFVSAFTTRWPMVFGLVYVLAVMYMSRGIVPALLDRYRWIRSRRRGEESTTRAGAEGPKPSDVELDTEGRP